ncbi:efflux RND transporter permease subunit [Tumebacillus permanentifrigoris]|uniref:HAE1 family hydrophobic/amphiphilic exporter-1 n=1 Tax=Tumebacillus permanentifrigoris TaxID=378543 RepID=A0A316D8S1_9BACL|nr:efflux RND transporter permease subunit [Tumebacillus permanentifrigoris]PWK13382.1 HAE1 family hydrophobic/amphiphilic exporter-1 [Tumebacillus permanentifrigoris]
MNFLTRVSLKNPVAIFILSFLLIVGGLFSFQSLKVDLLPNIEFPQLSIEAVYPGASPQDVEKQVTSILEKQFKGIQGIDKMSSQSFESIALIQLQFPFGTNMDDVTQQVQSLITSAQLPDRVEPKVNRFSFGSFPVLNAAVFAKDGRNAQDVLVNDIQPQLEKIPGVNSVSIGGTESELVNIQVNKEAALKKGLSLAKIQETIKGKFVSMPAGSVVNDSILIPIRVEEKLLTVADLEQMQLDVQTAQPSTGAGTGGTGMGAPGASSNVAPAPVLLRDIATIKTETSRPEITRFNDKEAIALALTKKQDSNTVEVVDRARTILDANHDKIDYAIVFDQADGIKKSVNSLIREGLLGALFASLAVLLFLRNIRATIIAVLSIPLSLLVSSIFLAQAGITLNTMTLGGMAVAVGRVVDDSIVVIENIFRRIKHNPEGLDKKALTLAATREMLKAITSSTLTTIVVFLPLGFVGGVVGQFFLPFALTIVFALAASLVVSITLTPLLSRYSFAKLKHEETEGKLQQWYGRLIDASLRKKWVVFAVCIPLLLASFGLAGKLGFVFLPNEKQKTIIANVSLPASTVLDKTNQVSLDVETMLRGRAETVQSVFVGIGSRDFTTGLKKENTFQYYISLKETADTTAEVNALNEQIKSIVGKTSDKATITVQEMSSGGPPSNNNIDIDLYSNDQTKLLAASRAVEDKLKEHAELSYIKSNLSDTQRQWVIKIDTDKAATYGVSGYTVLGLTADQTRPVSVGTLALDGKDRSVQLSYDKPLASKSELEDLTLFGTKGPVQLKQIAEVQEIDAVSAIQKNDGKVFARVSATVEGTNVQQVSAAVQQDITDHVKLPDGVSLVAGGGSDETTKTFQQLGLAMGVAVGLVYLVMLFTFGQARIPFIILTSLLFVPTGALIGLYAAGEPISISAMIGVLMLIGIVVTNAIVLVDRVGQNRDNGMPIRASLIEAGKTRLRPIIMTAFATICALLPLAFTAAEGNLISRGLAVVVIGGLTTATLLTLVIVPVMYELFFRRQHRKEQAQV